MVDTGGQRQTSLEIGNEVTSREVGEKLAFTGGQKETSLEIGKELTFLEMVEEQLASLVGTEGQRQT